MRKSNHHSQYCKNTKNLGHRHKHIAHLIDRGIQLTKLIKIYCKKLNFIIKIKINNY